MSQSVPSVLGMTLASLGMALTEPDTYSDFSALEKDFIAAFWKMGIKHNVVALRYILFLKRKMNLCGIVPIDWDNISQDAPQEKCQAHKD